MRAGLQEYLLSTAPRGDFAAMAGDVLLDLWEGNWDPSHNVTDIGSEILRVVGELGSMLFDADADLTPLVERFGCTEQHREKVSKMFENWRSATVRARPYYLSLPVWPEFAVPNNKVDGLLPSCRVESWTHFVDVVRNRDHNRAKLEMVYRGQRGFSWPLSPTLARKFPNGVIREGDRDQLLENFRLAMRGRGPDFTGIDETEVWAYGQHVGLATPLLDWSKSPFVSLYFAFSDPDVDGEDNPSRAVYCLDLTRLKAELPELFVEPKSNDNARLVNQAGLFTLTPAGRESLETYIINALEKSSAVDFDGFVDVPTAEDGFEFPADETAKRLSSYLSKIHIPNQGRDDCLAMLRKMNIHHGSLFPDPFGAAQYCNDWLQRSIREDEEEAQQKRILEEAAKKAEQELSKTTPSKPTETIAPSPADLSLRQRVQSALQTAIELEKIIMDAGETADKIIKNYMENESIDWVLKETSKARIRTELTRQLSLLGAGSVGKKLALELTDIFDAEYRSKNDLIFDRSPKTSFFKIVS